MKPQEHFHGSDLEKIEAFYHIKKEDIISFAANVNPLGISFRLRETLASHIDAITTYPDREYTSLRRCISDYVKIPIENILVGNGSTELISLFIHITRPNKALIVGPTYSEYEREVTLGGGSFQYFSLDEANDFSLNLTSLKEQLAADVDLLILCNPNNPTSSVVSREDMIAILEFGKANDITVLCDETYIEFAEDTANLTAIPLTSDFSNLIVLRGISKFFAAPGLRLGYAICGNHRLLNKIEKKKNPWTINSLAAIAGEIMFTDQEYIQKTTHLISSERTRICKRLRTNPHFKVYEPSANFVLVKILDSSVTSGDVFDATIRHGLMIRDCSSFPFLGDNFFRFCFMEPEQNDALLDIIFPLFPY